MPLKMSAKETSLAFSINLHPPQYLLWGPEIFFFFFFFWLSYGFGDFYRTEILLAL